MPRAAIACERHEAPKDFEFMLLSASRSARRGSGRHESAAAYVEFGAAAATPLRFSLSGVSDYSLSSSKAGTSEHFDSDSDEMWEDEVWEACRVEHLGRCRLSGAFNKWRVHEAAPPPAELVIADASPTTAQDDGDGDVLSPLHTSAKSGRAADRKASGSSARRTARPDMEVVSTLRSLELLRSQVQRLQGAYRPSNLRRLRAVLSLADSELRQAVALHALPPGGADGMTPRSCRPLSIFGGHAQLNGARLPAGGSAERRRQQQLDVHPPHAAASPAASTPSPYSRGVPATPRACAPSLLELDALQQLLVRGARERARFRQAQAGSWGRWLQSSAPVGRTMQAHSCAGAPNATASARGDAVRRAHGGLCGLLLSPLAVLLAVLACGSSAVAACAALPAVILARGVCALLGSARLGLRAGASVLGALRLPWLSECACWLLRTPLLAGCGTVGELPAMAMREAAAGGAHPLASPPRFEASLPPRTPSSGVSTSAAVTVSPDPDSQPPHEEAVSGRTPRPANAARATRPLTPETAAMRLLPAHAQRGHISPPAAPPPALVRLSIEPPAARIPPW